MNDTEFHIVEAIPEAAAYAALRAGVGWNALPVEAVKQGLQGALYSVCVYRAEQLVGFGRILGDGGIYFYLQDVIVLPEFQGRGLGQQIMEKLMGYLQANAQSGAFVGLMAARGAEGFYLKYGFERRGEDRPGMYRVWA